MNENRRRKKKPAIPKRYQQKWTMDTDEIPEGWHCKGPETELASLVCHAARDKDYDFLREYIGMMRCVDEDEFDLNEQDQMGMTALHFAVSLKDVPTTHLLIDVGASCNVKDTQGFTPLFYATGRYACLEIASYLLTKGKASVHAVTKTGASPLHGAALMGNAECVKLLLKHGADPRSEDEDSNAPLDLAKDEETKRLLHKYGRKKDEARDKIGECCANCGEESSQLKRCGKCHVTMYCDRGCQAMHWREGGHKHTCTGYILASSVGSLGQYTSTISMKKKTVYSTAPNDKQGGQFLKNKQFIVKVQTPLGGSAIPGMSDQAMVYNEDRTVQGFIPSHNKGYDYLKKKIADEGWMGVKAFFWAELNDKGDDGSFKVYHGRCAPFQGW